MLFITGDFILVPFTEKILARCTRELLAHLISPVFNFVTSRVSSSFAFIFFSVYFYALTPMAPSKATQICRPTAVTRHRIARLCNHCVCVSIFYCPRKSEPCRRDEIHTSYLLFTVRYTRENNAMTQSDREIYRWKYYERDWMLFVRRERMRGR